MIPNQWYVILDSREIKKNRIIGFRRFGENLVAWRDCNGQIAVFRDRCPHRGIKLSLGKVKEGHIQCPFHGFEYDPAGKCKLIPANGKAATVPDHIRTTAYPVTEANGFIYAWYTPDPDKTGMPGPSDIPTVPWFDDIDSSFSSSSFTDLWKAHYSRAIENQLDVVHVPFIHRTTIGRGIGPMVNGPYTETSDKGLKFWPSNTMDSGQRALRPDEMKEPVRQGVFISFLFPNLWQNHIMDSFRIVVAFAPVDDANTLFYLRTYQKMIKVPVLKELFSLVNRYFNRIVLHQDRRVVETHQPMATQFRMNENLIPGDHPVILYRKRRDELQKNSEMVK